MHGAVREVAISDGENAEGGWEAERGRRRRLLQRLRSVVGLEPELELLEAVHGGGPEPGVDRGCSVAEEAGGNAKAAAGARVDGNDIGINASKDVLVGVDGEEVLAVEVERRGAPDVAPPRLDDLGADGLLGGEERDDLAEDRVGEVADAVGSVSGRRLLVVGRGRRLGTGRPRSLRCRRHSVALGRR